MLIEDVGGAVDAGAAVEHVRVDHGGLEMAVAEKLLHGADVVTGFEQVGGERMTKRVAARLLRHAGSDYGLSHRPLDDGLVEMVAATLAGEPICVLSRRGENPHDGKSKRAYRCGRPRVAGFRRPSLMRFAYPLASRLCICKHICMCAIRFATGVESDLREFRAGERRKILDTLHRKLSHEPTRKTKHIKKLRHLVPPFEAIPPIWQLRIDDFRVFYDVDEAEEVVFVRAVKRKPPHRRTEEIL